MKLPSRGKDKNQFWEFDGVNLVSLDSKTEIKGKLCVFRDGKNSKFFFKSENNKVEFNLKTVKISIIPKKSTKDILKITFDNNGTTSEFLFRPKWLSKDDPATLLTYFLEEFEHTGYVFELNSNNQKIAITKNLFQSILYDEENKVKELSLPNSINKKIVITNFRIYCYDKAHKIVIDPIPLPTKVMAKEVKDIPIRTLFGSNENTSDLPTERKGMLVIYRPDSRHYRTLSNVKDPEFIEKEVSFFNERFQFEKPHSIQQNIYAGRDVNTPQMGVNNSNIKGNDNLNIQHNVTQLDLKQIQDILDTIKDIQIQNNLTAKTENLTEYVNLLESQIKSQNPSDKTIKFLFERVLEQINTTGVSHLFGMVINKISQLFDNA